MRVVYEAENMVDAHLAKHVLEGAGFPVFIRGEYLTGAIGELPTQGLVQVCVPEIAVPAARACLADAGMLGGDGEVDLGSPLLA